MKPPQPVRADRRQTPLELKTCKWTLAGSCPTSKLIPLGVPAWIETLSLVRPTRARPLLGVPAKACEDTYFLAELSAFHAELT
eukprot:4948438-Amphidinium_carterae.1